MNIEDHCFNATPPGQRDAVSCVTMSMALAAIEQARMEERVACAKLADELLEASTLEYWPDVSAAIRARKP